MKRCNWRLVWVKFLFYLIVLILIIISLLPFYWMAVTSFSPTSEMYSQDLSLWPKKFILTHYIKLIKETNFLIWFKNSWLIASLTTLLSLFVGCLAAFSLTRVKYPGKILISQFILGTYLIPRSLLFVPLYNVLGGIGLIDTHLGLVLAYSTFAVPFCTWLLVGYFKTIPHELDEAATIDGCSPLGVLGRIIVPVSLPGIVAAGIFTFNLANNEFLYAFTFINNESLSTLPRGISSMIMGDVYLWGKLMAACLLASVPLVILYMLVQKFMVSGLTAGSLKG